MIVPFWAAQNPSLWISHFPEFFFAFSFLGNFLSSGRGHAMGGGSIMCTTILQYYCWKLRGSFLGFSKCCLGLCPTNRESIVWGNASIQHNRR